MHLKAVVGNLRKEKGIDVYIDLGETLGFKYHTGIVFAAYADKASHALAKGGRYDGLGHSKDEPRPAVGPLLVWVHLLNGPVHHIDLL